MKNYIGGVEAKQRESGGFLDSSGVESVFSTSLILSCLNQCEESPQAKAVKQKAADFLLSQKNGNWMFSKDVNIDFCALSALAGFSKEIISGEGIARILAGLIFIESEEGGPYYSYFAEKGKDPDKNIDPAANISIAHFLSLEEVELPNLTELIEFAIVKGDFKSAFYQSVYPAIYSVSRFYKGGKKGRLIEFILAEKDKEKHWGNPLNASMAIIALLNLGYAAEKLSEETDHLKGLGEKELHKPYPLEKGKFSTAEVNIAFYLETSEKINKKTAGAGSRRSRQLETITINREEGEMFDRIMGATAKRFSTLPDGMRLMAFEEIQKTMKGNSDKQMSFMPYWFKKSLGKKADKVSDDEVARLGLMNIFFWTAFIIYDDFWDEEGTPRILPTANLYTRDFISFFDGLFPSGSDFNLFFRRLMDRLDAGNTQILVDFRVKVKGNKVFIPENIPDYGDYETVYEPSSAHILGPIAMLHMLDYSTDSPEARHLISYFRNYLIAMQINDDIYDWEEDLRRGHLSTVVVMLLRDLNRLGKEIDMERDLPEIKRAFWFKTLPKACKVAMKHTEKSRQALRKLTILENPAPLEDLVNSIENVAKTALKEHKYTEDFLRVFKV